MSFNIVNTNYAGETLSEIYTAFLIGNELAKENVALFKTGIASKTSLPRLTGTKRPFGPYTAGVPTADSYGVNYSERFFNPEDETIFMTFNPDQLLGTIWKEFQSQGDFTNLELNSRMLKAILDLLNEDMGEHISEQFWQGDKTADPSTKLHFFDGMMKKAIDAPGAIEVANIGLIIEGNIVQVLKNFFYAIPKTLIKNKDFIINVSVEDWSKLQVADLELKENFAGVLNTTLGDLFLQKRIRASATMAENTIFGGMQKNMMFSSYVSPEKEGMIIDKLSPAGKIWFMRLDAKMDCNFAVEEEIVYYNGEVI